VADRLGPARALILVLEGVLPFIVPGLWRWMFIEMIRSQDGWGWFFGLCCVLAGLLLWWSVT